jgi:hypothetical protein
VPGANWEGGHRSPKACRSAGLGNGGGDGTSTGNQVQAGDEVYAAAAFDELRVGLNEFGLIDTYAQATRVLRWMLGQPPERQPARRSSGEVTSC